MERERERETTLTRGSLSMDCQIVKTSQPVNFEQERVNVGQIAYFSLYLVGGFPAGTLKGLEKERIIWWQFIAGQTVSGNFPEPQALNEIKQFMHNHTIFSMSIRLKIINA